MVKSTRSGLGRGLNSLLGGYYDEPQQDKPVEKEQVAQKPVEKKPSSTERVVIESSDLQQVMNTEMAANKTSQPSPKAPDFPQFFLQPCPSSPPELSYQP